MVASIILITACEDKNADVTGISLDQTSIALAKGDSAILKAIVTPKHAISREVIWESDNTEVATVDNGIVTAVKAGTATITVITSDGRYRAACTVSVNAMTIITGKSGYVKIYMSGNGSFTIDWGDGTARETHSLQPYTWDWYVSSDYCYTHAFSGAYPDTVTITGENVTHLYCFDNHLTYLDVSKNTELKELHCSGNQIVSLDLSNNINLTNLQCYHNKIKSLDMRQNPVLFELLCSNNQLTGLFVDSNNLVRLDCDNNQLNAAALDALFEMLPDNSMSKLIVINDNPGTNSCNRNIATGKGWVF